MTVVLEPVRTATPAAVATRGLSKRYSRTVQALDRVDLECLAGQILVLVGPSGCGKTSWLRCVAGLETPTSGTISIDGADVTRVDPERRGVAMVFQNYALYPSKSVADNLAFPLRMARIPRRERQGRVREVARLLRIDDLLERKPAQLSGGQRQRVGIGRALVRGPRLLLMDEPLSNLDAQLRVEMRAELLTLQRNLGTTIAYVTHDQTEALTLGDQIAVLDRGRVLQTASPNDIFRRPATAFVAAFLGGMNLLEGTVEDHRLLWAGARQPPRLPSNLAVRRGENVLLGVRPEDVRIGTGADDGFSVHGRVVLVETLGSEQLVHLELGGGARLRARVPVEQPIEEHLTVFAAAQRLHVFDAAGDRGRR